VILLGLRRRGVPLGDAKQGLGERSFAAIESIETVDHRGGEFPEVHAPQSRLERQRRTSGPKGSRNLRQGPAAAKPRNGHVLGLDLIRFCAAAMVLAFHYGHDISSVPLSWCGWVGVEIFFVLSGYVISASAEGSTPWTFARNRIARLMPAVWICSTFAAAVCLAEASYPDLPMRFLKSLVLWPTGPWVDGALWTLPIEVVFYGLVFLCLLRKVPLGWLLRTIAVVSGGYWTSRLVGLSHAGFAAFGWASDAVATLSMLRFGCYFALGGLIRETLSEGWSYGRAAFLAISLATGAIEIAFTGSNWVPDGGVSWLPHAQKLVPLALWLGTVAAMVVSLKTNSAAWRQFALAGPTIRLLGLATYPIYLLHDPIGNALKLMPALRSPFIAAVLTLGLSIVFAATVERWARRALKSLMEGRRLSQPALQVDPS
jgi:exopolysaccharide production protein ExoZ